MNILKSTIWKRERAWKIWHDFVYNRLICVLKISTNRWWCLQGGGYGHEALEFEKVDIHDCIGIVWLMKIIQWFEHDDCVPSSKFEMLSNRINSFMVNYFGIRHSTSSNICSVSFSFTRYLFCSLVFNSIPLNCGLLSIHFVKWFQFKYL